MDNAAVDHENKVLDLQGLLASAKEDAKTSQLDAGQ